MEAYHVVKAETEKSGLIVHKIDVGNGKLKTFHYTSVRAGLSWSSAEAPAFYVIIGQEYVPKTKYEGQQPPKGKLKFFKEQEISSSFLHTLFNQLTDDCTLFNCRHVYTDLGDEHEADADFFNDFIYDKKIPHISLEEAPFVDSFGLGVSLIKRFMADGFLNIPKDSQVREQLKRLARADLQDPQAARRFHAVNALRYVIGSFHKSPMPGRRFHPKRKKSLRGGKF